MLQFLWRVAKRVPGAFWDTSDRLFLAVEIMLVAGAVIPGISDVIRRTLTPNLYWISVGCLAALAVAGLLRAVFAEYEELRLRVAGLETELGNEQAAAESYPHSRGLLAAS